MSNQNGYTTALCDYHGQSLRFGLACVPSMICTKVDRAESQTDNADAWRRLNAAISPTVATPTGSGWAHGALRLVGTVTIGGTGCNVPQAVSPGSKHGGINSIASTRRFLDGFNSTIGPFSDHDGFGVKRVSSAGDRFRHPGLLNGVCGLHFGPLAAVERVEVPSQQRQHQKGYAGSRGV